MNDFRRGSAPAGVTCAPGAITVTWSPTLTPSERASSAPSTMFQLPGTSFCSTPLFSRSAASEVILASSSGTTPRTTAPRMPSPWASSDCVSVYGAAARMPGSRLSAFFASPCQSASALPFSSISCTCAMAASMRSRTSFWNPFITDNTMIRAATPRPMPSIDTSEMNEMNELRRPARPARV